MTDDRKLLLQLIASLSLADHMGDVADDVAAVLKQLGLEDAIDREDADFWCGIRKGLHKLGITTIYDTSIGDDE